MAIQLCFIAFIITFVMRYYLILACCAIHKAYNPVGTDLSIKLLWQTELQPLHTG